MTGIFRFWRLSYGPLEREAFSSKWALQPLLLSICCSTAAGNPLEKTRPLLIMQGKSEAAPNGSPARNSI